MKKIFTFVADILLIIYYGFMALSMVLVLTGFSTLNNDLLVKGFTDGQILTAKTVVGMLLVVYGLLLMLVIVSLVKVCRKKYSFSYQLGLVIPFSLFFLIFLIGRSPLQICIYLVVIVLFIIDMARKDNTANEMIEE